MSSLVGAAGTEIEATVDSENNVGKQRRCNDAE